MRVAEGDESAKPPELGMHGAGIGEGVTCLVEVEVSAGESVFVLLDPVVGREPDGRRCQDEVARIEHRGSRTARRPAAARPLAEQPAEALERYRVEDDGELYEIDVHEDPQERKAGLLGEARETARQRSSAREPRYAAGVTTTPRELRYSRFDLPAGAGLTSSRSAGLNGGP